jgi:hypothetical protein
MDGGISKPATCGADEVMVSASQIRFGAVAMNLRSSRFAAIGKSWQLSVVRTRRGRTMMALIP